MEFYRIKSNILPKVHFVDDTLIEPPYVHRRRKPEEYIMYIIRQGEMYLAEDGRPIVLQTGDVCLLDKDRTHVGTKPSVCDYYYIHFLHDEIEPVMLDDTKGPDFLYQQRMDSMKSNIFSYEQCHGAYIYLPKVWHVEDMGLWIRLEELLQKAKMDNYNPLEHYKIMCACQVQQIMIEVARGFLASRSDEGRQAAPEYFYLVQSVTEWLNREYASQISGDLLSKKFHSNFDYMNRVFKRTMGETIFQYLTNVRINHAKILILHTQMKMSEIGKRVGFPDEYYFNRVFKKNVGVPPASYGKKYHLQKSL